MNWVYSRAVSAQEHCLTPIVRRERTLFSQLLPSAGALRYYLTFTIGFPIVKTPLSKATQAERAYARFQREGAARKVIVLCEQLELDSVLGR